MADVTTELRAELSAQRAELADLRRRLDRQPRDAATWRAPKRPRRARCLLAALSCAVLLALVPLALLAATPFNDLNAGSVHNANIQAIYDAGITTGCNPGVSYCPNAFVTREEMASFLAR